LTELRAAEALFDSKLQVTIDNEASKKQLNEVLSFKLRQQQIQDNLDRGNLEELEKLQTTNEHLRESIANYIKAANAEIEEARQLRVIGRTQANEEAAKAIAASEKHLTVTQSHLETATDKLTDLLAEEGHFRNQYLVLYPALIGVFLFALLVITGIFSQSVLWALLQNIAANLVNFLLGSAIAILIYLGLVWLKYNTDIRSRILKVQKQIKQLESAIKSSAIELRRSYNEKLKLDYDLYAQNLRVETLNYLIKAAKQKTETLRQTLDRFSQIYNDLVREREQATVKFSEIRLAVLTDTDIDAYYQSFLSTQPTKKFTIECVSRSQSWKISDGEFQNQLTPFAQKQFEQLSNLSIGSVLKETDLIAANTATLRLNQLHDTANLLLRIQDIDTNLNPTSQRETTLWVGTKDKEEIFGFYSRLSRNLTAVISEDEQKLCVLSRSLGFPAYFLSQIEFYRDCYERTQNEQDEIPDLIPDEIGSSRELKEGYESLLLAIALQIVSQSQGDYQFNGQSLGKDREQIASAIATEFNFQELYEELKESIEAFEHDLIYQNLQQFGTSAKNLTRHERKLLDNLLSTYNPLN
jgi:hypothetical protein